MGYWQNKKGLKERASELEKEFIIWGDILDEQLMIYYNHAHKYSLEYLDDRQTYFIELLEEMYMKNEEYFWSSDSKHNHPNYEKACQRLNRILDIIDYEIDCRKK